MHQNRHANFWYQQRKNWILLGSKAWETIMRQKWRILGKFNKVNKKVFLTLDVLLNWFYLETLTDVISNICLHSFYFNVFYSKMLMQQIKANHAKSCYHTFMGSLCHFQHINIYGALPNALLYMLPYILNGTSTYMHPFQCVTTHYH